MKVYYSMHKNEKQRVEVEVEVRTLPRNIELEYLTYKL